MKVETYKCDVCGKVKGDVNHWWIVALATDREVGFGLVLVAWSEEALDDRSLNHLEDARKLHLCGSECVQKKVNEFMSKQVSAPSGG